MEDLDNDDTLNGAAEAFGKLEPMGEGDEPEGDEDALDTDDEGYDDTSTEGDEPEGDEQDDEPGEPAIEPPASWDAEARERFAKLPPEDQRYIADRESQRDRFVQAKAAEAQQHRDAARAALDEHIQLRQQYAEQLDTYAKLFEPQRPDYSLLASDPQAYAYQQAVYDRAIAQRGEIAQQAERARQEAQAIQNHQARAEAQAELQRLVEAIPEWNDGQKRGEMVQALESVGRELGYSDDLLAQARASDVIALKKAAEWREGYLKYKALQGKRMEAVRAAKGKPKVSIPGTAQPRGSGRKQALQDSMQTLRKSGSLDAAAAAFRNLG